MEKATSLPRYTAHVVPGENLCSVSSKSKAAEHPLKRKPALLPLLDQRVMDSFQAGSIDSVQWE